jgi:hypothetical protein
MIIYLFFLRVFTEYISVAVPGKIKLDTYKDFSNLQQLVGEILWGQNLVIRSRVKDL